MKARTVLSRPLLGALAIGTLVLAGTAFSTVAVGHPQVDPYANVRLNWSFLQAGPNSRATSAGLVVIENRVEFEAWWARHTGNPPETAPRTVDFTKSRVVAVHLGTRNTGGFRVQIQQVRPIGPGKAQVTAQEVTPAPGDAVTQALTSPYSLATVDRSVNDFVLSWLPARPATGLFFQDAGRIPGNAIVVMPVPIVILGLGSFPGTFGGSPVFLNSLDGTRQWWRQNCGERPMPRLGLDWRQQQVVIVPIEGPANFVPVLQGRDLKGPAATLRLSRRSTFGRQVNAANEARFMMVAVPQTVREVKVEWVRDPRG